MYIILTNVMNFIENVPQQWTGLVNQISSVFLPFRFGSDLLGAIKMWFRSKLRENIHTYTVTHTFIYRVFHLNFTIQMSRDGCIWRKYCWVKCFMIWGGGQLTAWDSAAQVRHQQLMRINLVINFVSSYPIKNTLNLCS